MSTLRPSFFIFAVANLSWTFTLAPRAEANFFAKAMPSPSMTMSMSRFRSPLKRSLTEPPTRKALESSSSAMSPASVRTSYSPGGSLSRSQEARFFPLKVFSSVTVSLIRLFLR